MLAWPVSRIFLVKETSTLYSGALLMLIQPREVAADVLSFNSLNSSDPSFSCECEWNQRSKDVHYSLFFNM